MSRPKLKGETKTVRVSFLFWKLVTRDAKDERLSIPDFIDKHYLEKP